MKTKILFLVCFALISLFLSSASSAQEKQEKLDPKKPLDAFVSATTKSTKLSEPVPGAEIAIEPVSGPTVVKTCKTTEYGEIAINISNIDEFQGKDTKEIKFMITIKQVDKTKFKTAETKMPLTLKKSDGPFYALVLMYDKESNKFFVEQNKNTEGSSTGIRKEKPDTSKVRSYRSKRDKGDASKPGDKYMGQVAHF